MIEYYVCVYGNIVVFILRSYIFGNYKGWDIDRIGNEMFFLMLING